MGRKSDYRIRDPKVATRDPVPEGWTDDTTTRKPRRYIEASMPCVCPVCGHATRMADGRHIDPVRRRVLEYRTCAWCGEKLAAGRAMTEREAETLCSHADAVEEYQKLQR